MPDTKTWRVLTSTERTPPPLSDATIGLVDAALDACADGLGFTLADRATLEAAVFGTAVANYVQSKVGRETPASGRAFDKEMILTYAIVNWLLIERLRRIEST